ncbi:MAG TPA: RES family NAD+ phosphorylase [Thermomicrobiales bacterium]|nr:RES family NAD+ phosphorylase [Thermomicrobiales bacterium]
MAPSEAAPPGLHPEPAGNLSSRALPVRDVTGNLYRLHRADHDPLHFGRSARNRFDDPNGQFGVLYAGDSPACAFVETYGRLDHIPRLLTERELGDRCLSRLVPRSPLRAVDLSAAGLRRLDADNRLCAGDYRIAQRWSAALHDHPDRPDSILYRSRHDPSRVCLALFDRAVELMDAERLGSLIEDRHSRLLAEILDRYDFGLL